MSRFTSDMGAVDQQLSLELDNCGQLTVNFLMLCGLVMVLALSLHPTPYPLPLTPLPLTPYPLPLPLPLTRCSPARC